MGRSSFWNVDNTSEGHFQQVARVFSERSELAEKENSLLRQELKQIKLADREFLKTVCLLENKQLKEEIQLLQEKVKLLEEKESRTREYYKVLADGCS